MTGMKYPLLDAMHIPHCNTECDGPEHWLSTDQLNHTHADGQRRWCEQCQIDQLGARRRHPTSR